MTESLLTASAMPPRPHVDPLALGAGAVLSEFEVRRVLGCGGFGIVYLARDASLERDVAVKEYLPTSLAGRAPDGRVQPRSAEAADAFDAGLRSFVNEARLLARFDHPSLVKVHRFWEANGTAYMAMPYYQGPTLRQVRKSLAEPPDEAWLQRLLDGLLGALDVLHRAGVVHRDVAPDNILMQPDGTPVLLDFGAARQVLAEQTQALTAMLKPTYAPIEQYADAASCRQGPWTDLYATAATVHNCLTGEAPPAAALRALDDRYRPLHQRAELRQHDGLPYDTRWLAAIDWALEVLPGRRPQSVADWWAVLHGRRPLPRPRSRGVKPPAAGRVPALHDAVDAFPQTELHARQVPEAGGEVPVRALVLREPAGAAGAVPARREASPWGSRWRLRWNPRWRPAVPAHAAAWHRPALATAAFGLLGALWFFQFKPVDVPGAGRAFAAAELGTAPRPNPLPSEPGAAPRREAAAGPWQGGDEIFETAAEQGRVIQVAPRVFVTTPPAPAVTFRTAGAAPEAAPRKPRAGGRRAVVARAAPAPASPKAMCEAGDRGWFSRMFCMHRSCSLPQWRDHPECAGWNRSATAQSLPGGPT